MSHDDEEIEFLTIRKAAALLRVPVATLRWWRSRRVGPSSRKFGRLVRYARGALLRWADAQGRSRDDRAEGVSATPAPTRTV